MLPMDMAWERRKEVWMGFGGAGSEDNESIGGVESGQVSNAVRTPAVL